MYMWQVHVPGGVTYAYLYAMLLLCRLACLCAATKSVHVDGVRFDKRTKSYSLDVLVEADVSPVSPRPAKGCNTSSSRRFLDNLVQAFSDASEVMKEATARHANISEVRVFLPRHWPRDGIPHGRVPLQCRPEKQDAKVSIVIKKESQVYVSNPYPRCGVPFMGNMYLSWGNFSGYQACPKDTTLSRILVHEFAHLRWGVYDEYTRTSGPLCPHGAKGNGPWSLMASTSNKSVLFCNQSSSAYAVQHDRSQETPQNRECGHKSAWEVLMSHPDFSNFTWPKDAAHPRGRGLRPKFQFIMPCSRQSTVFVMDVSPSVSPTFLRKSQAIVNNYLEYMSAYSNVALLTYGSGGNASAAGWKSTREPALTIASRGGVRSLNRALQRLDTREAAGDYPSLKAAWDVAERLISGHAPDYDYRHTRKFCAANNIVSKLNKVVILSEAPRLPTMHRPPSRTEVLFTSETGKELFRKRNRSSRPCRSHRQDLIFACSRNDDLGRCASDFLFNATSLALDKSHNVTDGDRAITGRLDVRSALFHKKQVTKLRFMMVLSGPTKNNRTPYDGMNARTGACELNYVINLTFPNHERRALSGNFCSNRRVKQFGVPATLQSAFVTVHLPHTVGLDFRLEVYVKRKFK
ncbi:uncharacterized protein LOC135813647 [Sycon ciliatum]|uniref:uncharacterized protein LOC135813647 n=1 Tax=Sycon ciliatum TaxID=27933 RepID=UPI0031F6343F